MVSHFIKQTELLHSQYLVFSGADNVKYVGYGHDFIGMQEVTEVAKTYAHESFDEDTLQNDIMLVRTVKNFPKIPGVHPVDYNTKPQADDYLYNTMVSAGWGQLYSVISTTPNRLEYTIFAMQPQSTCTANNTQSKSELPYNPQFQICARTDRKCNLCFGDVGSPLVVGNVVYGITSRLMVPNNCARGYPDVFTRVSQYDGWIKRKMSKKN